MVSPTLRGRSQADRSRTVQSGRGITRRLVDLPLIVLVLALSSACESLLDVELSGVVEEENLNDPFFARTLAISAQGDFECAFSNHVWAIGIWNGDFHSASNTRTNLITQSRDIAFTTLSALGSAGNQPHCRQTNPPPFTLPLHTARTQAVRAIDLITEFDASDVPDKDFLIGLAYVYQGYSIQILAESHCELTIDVGPSMTRAQGFDLARQHFTSALEQLAQVGSSNAEARSLENMALVGRARASLQLGDDAGVLADAGQVDPGFVRNIHRSAAAAQTRNHIFQQDLGDNLSVTEPYRNLDVGGVPDPRVPTTQGGQFGSDGITDIWRQLKYPSRDADIPLATWREAQLMIAEVTGGQTAVGIINQLRATVSDLPWVDDSHPGLPEFSSSDPDEILAQVIEERRRELFLQGARIGDMLRHPDIWPPTHSFGDREFTPFPTGLSTKGERYGSFTCIPLQDREVLSNPNLTSQSTEPT